MTIVVDTREKRPLDFPEGVDVESGTLHQGDYAIKGDHAFAIERKSLKDFRNTMVAGWDRFQRELLRMHLCGYAPVIVVEGDMAHFLYHETPDGIDEPPMGDDKVFTPGMLMNRLGDLVVKYRANVVWAGDEVAAGAFVYHALISRLSQLHGNANLPKQS